MKRILNNFFQLSIFVILICILHPSKVSAAKIKLLMPQTIDKNEVFPVQVYLDTEGELTVGTDLLFSFDTKDLKFKQVDQADFYDNYHEAKIYLDKNQIRYSGTSNYKDYQQGNALLATFFFKKKKIGKPQINLIWQKNRTDDTNVIGVKGQDLLDQKPTIVYDNSLAVKPNPKNKNNGQILGETTLGNFLFEEFNDNVLGVATRTKTSSVWWLIIILLAILLLLFFIWKKKRKERNQSV